MIKMNLTEFEDKMRRCVIWAETNGYWQLAAVLWKIVIGKPK